MLFEIDKMMNKFDIARELIAGLRSEDARGEDGVEVVSILQKERRLYVPMTAS